MSDAKERSAQKQSLREEAALPVPASSPGSTGSSTRPAALADWATKRRTTLRVVGGTLLLTVAMSAALEYAGWQILFTDNPAARGPIPPLSFLRGMWDNTLGAVGIGAAGALLALVLPSSWRDGWRRVPAAFALGAAGFIGFLSFVTFGFFW